MTKKEELQAQLARIKIIEKWPKRLAKLDKSEKQFCDDNGLPVAGFSRMKNLKVIASQDNVDKVEAAFESEGV